MAEGHGPGRGLLGEFWQSLQPVRDAGEHCVRRCLGGQGDEDSLSSPLGANHLSHSQRGLRLSSSSAGLDEHEPHVHSRGQLNRCLLNGVRNRVVGEGEPGAEERLEVARVHGRWLPRRRHRRLLPSVERPRTHVKSRRPILVATAERKQSRV